MTSPAQNLSTLAEWPLYKRAVVSRVHTKDRKRLQKMIAMGILPKTEIILIKKFPSYVFKIHNTQFCVDRELAGSIYLQEAGRGF